MTVSSVFKQSRQRLRCRRRLGTADAYFSRATLAMADKKRRAEPEEEEFSEDDSEFDEDGGERPPGVVEEEDDDDELEAG